MSQSVTPEEAIFVAALEKGSRQEREAYVAAACGTDATLAARVRELLAAHEGNSGPLDATLPGAEPGTLREVIERPGTQIGPYKLRQVIGEGGMGVVYMASQREPVERRVALKIIKPGMDSRQVIARFEAERQALALMDHPNIARVLDGGTTGEAAGRPFFVMELVKGVPITQYCDEHHLTSRQRLELFVPVCQAIHHAHQKGIIHRDIKPSNVLIAEYDQQPVPKIIDFGVAKAIGQRLTEKTMFTEFGQVVGTIEYMSPEQAKLNQLDIDTRTDIYSLGVLLYELLAGITPFDRKRLQSAAFDEMLRIIREEDPPKPSTRLSTIDTLPSVAANRSVQPARLRKEIRGELDWIVMKCLEKGRDRRYDTASGLAADLLHFLHDEPVLACPPSLGYRLGKFSRKHKGALALAAAGLIVLVVFASGLGLRFREVTGHRAELDAQIAETIRCADPRLPGILAGEHRLTEKELTELANLCQRQNLHASAAGLYRLILPAAPQSGRPYFEAALAAARAGTGQSLDAMPAKPPERLRWRRQAIEWFQTDLATLRSDLDSKSPETRERGRLAIQQRLQNRDLARLRAAWPTLYMAPGERAEMLEIWRQMDEVAAAGE